MEVLLIVYLLHLSIKCENTSCEELELYYEVAEQIQHRESMTTDFYLIISDCDDI